MQLETIFSFIQFTIYFNLYNVVVGNPMFGPNVRDANSGEFPFIVALKRLVAEPNISNDHICTGSLITRQDVLTAAHCIQDEIMREVQVIIGTHDLRRGTPYEIYWWISYNKWSELMDIEKQFKVNDIGSIRLARLVPANIDFGVLNHLPSSALYNKAAVTAAWGKNENHTIPYRMRIADLTVLELKECEKRVERLIRRKFVLHERHICTVGDPYAVMYFGDSGSPVLYRNTIVAINKATIPFPDDPTNTRKINASIVISWYKTFIDFIIDPYFNCYDYDLDLMITE